MSPLVSLTLGLTLWCLLGVGWVNSPYGKAGGLGYLMVLPNLIIGTTLLVVFYLLASIGLLGLRALSKPIKLLTGVEFNIE